MYRYRPSSFSSQRGVSHQLTEREMSDRFVDSHQIKFATTHTVFNQHTLEREFSNFYERDNNKRRVVAILADHQQTFTGLIISNEERFGLDQRRNGKPPLLGSMYIHTWNVTIPRGEFLVFQEVGEYPSTFQRQEPTFNANNKRGLSIMGHVLTVALLSVRLDAHEEEDTRGYNVTAYRAPHTAYQRPSPTVSEEARDFDRGFRRLFPHIPTDVDPSSGIWQVIVCDPKEKEVFEPSDLAEEDTRNYEVTAYP